METITWIVTGALVGWAAHSWLGLNEARGKAVSMAMGAVGALAGGKGLAPLFVVAPLAPISIAGFVFAAGAAAALLIAANVVQNRWDV